jgi:hypothetical protein
MRAALRRLLDEHRHALPRLEAAGYRSSQDFTEELVGLLESSSQELTPKLLSALFGGAEGGRLGRLLEIA